MRRFSLLEAIAAPFPFDNVDTDAILPAKFLKTTTRTGLGAGLFHALRWSDKGEQCGFILDRPPWNKAQILVAFDNFGCGSSREHAPWALEDFGIRCIVAASFADIFYNNCVKNGILPVALPRLKIERLAEIVADSSSSKLTVDLIAQRVTAVGDFNEPFEILPDHKVVLLEGLDEIGETLMLDAQIELFEGLRRELSPWLPRSSQL